MSAPSGALDRAALERLYLRLEGPMYNVVYRWVWDPEAARDIVQESFVRLWNMRDRVRLEGVEALAYKIALNLAANHRRARKLRRWFGLERAASIPDPGPSAEDTRRDQQERRALHEAIDALPEGLRAVLVLSTFSELSYAEIADALSISPGTVASRRHAAVARLKAHLAQEPAHD